MMTESEFIRMSEELFEHIEDQIDENGWDFDCQFAGQNGKWLATRDSRDFYDVLNEALSAASGEAVEIAEL